MENVESTGGNGITDIEEERGLLRRLIILGSGDPQEEIFPPIPTYGLGYVDGKELNHALSVLNEEGKKAEGIPDYVKPVAQYLIENKNQTVLEIFRGLSKKVEEDDIAHALDWLHYNRYTKIEIIQRGAIKIHGYSLNPDNLKLLKYLVSES